jgi:hypothetical protein
VLPDALDVRHQERDAAVLGVVDARVEEYEVRDAFLEGGAHDVDHVADRGDPLVGGPGALATERARRALRAEAARAARLTRRCDPCTVADLPHRPAAGRLAPVKRGTDRPRPRRGARRRRRRTCARSRRRPSTAPQRSCRADGDAYADASGQHQVERVRREIGHGPDRPRTPSSTRAPRCARAILSWTDHAPGAGGSRGRGCPPAVGAR